MGIRGCMLSKCRCYRIGFNRRRHAKNSVKTVEFSLRGRRPFELWGVIVLGFHLVNASCRLMAFSASCPSVSWRNSSAVTLLSIVDLSSLLVIRSRFTRIAAISSWIFCISLSHSPTFVMFPYPSIDLSCSRLKCSSSSICLRIGSGASAKCKESRQSLIR